MSDLFNRLSSLISPDEVDPILIKSTPLFKLPTLKADNLEEPEVKKEEIPLKKDQSAEKDNVDALKRLRDLPRGSQVDSRIAAIQALLGEKELFSTLMMLRWPEGIICPRCNSTNVVRRDPPMKAKDKRHYYICLNCKGEGNPSDFDDFTGLPIGTLHSLRQWILCWYLMGFCSIHQISKVLGIGINEVLQMASIGSELTMLPDEEQKMKAEKTLKEKDKKKESDKKTKQTEQDEEFTKSASKSPKPGYKSRL